MKDKDKKSELQSIETPLGPLKIRTDFDTFGKWLKDRLKQDKKK
jgi:hypothetical protein